MSEPIAQAKRGTLGTFEGRVGAAIYGFANKSGVNSMHASTRESRFSRRPGRWVRALICRMPDSDKPQGAHDDGSDS
jgi:hypothetical protein